MKQRVGLKPMGNENYYPPAEAGGNFELPQASACGINNEMYLALAKKVKKIEIETLLI